MSFSWNDSSSAPQNTDGDIDHLAARRLAVLSPRETEVLQQLLDGKSQTQMADDLFVSHHTVHSHVKNILAKINVHSSLEAVSLAVRAGMRPTGTWSGEGWRPPPLD